ncbi:unnamed protein product [Triticum turgidum subsp. durum]|uniref:non-specific serine/threonine protein kinase n=1 Tax=Triticum turgidum subsp. durum TaxID=4567 RepID=A0A9R0QL68_TRITD|nr:unnamed protein product [Triticum turgidum subsp. durum]
MSNKFSAIWMEFIPNHDLGHHLSDASKSEVLDWPKRLQIIMGICKGLGFLHGREKPIRHLDLKPANILLDKDLTPKIADFGLSRIYNDNKTRLTKSSYGTVEFMPPEYQEFPFEISMKFDIFSLGATMIKIITGPEGNIKRDQTPGKEEYIKRVRTSAFPLYLDIHNMYVSLFIPSADYFLYYALHG